MVIGTFFCWNMLLFMRSIWENKRDPTPSKTLQSQDRNFGCGNLLAGRSVYVKCMTYSSLVGAILSYSATVSIFYTIYIYGI